MQKLNWYYQRLKAMSPAEIACGMQSCLRDKVDKHFVGRRQLCKPLSELFDCDGNDTEQGFHVCNIDELNKYNLTEYESLLARAEKIVQNRLTFFDLKDKFLGDPINWNRDHKLEKDTPMIFSSSLDYRDISEAGDCKFVWEPNRHHQLVVLGRAYHLSGDIRFAQAIAKQLDSWLLQNPYGLGMNWRSNLELGVRLINWVWAIDLIRDSKAIRDELYLRLMNSVVRHIWEIDRKYVRGSSVNNHLIGEAAGVFVTTSYFRNLKNAAKWRDKSREILIREILNQTYSDGGTKEQAIGYHIFVLQFFVIAGVIARASGQDFPESYWLRLEKMFDFAAKLSEGGDNLPMFGDCDDGYVLDIGNNPRGIKQWLAVGTALFNRDDFNTSNEQAEPVQWLPGLSKSNHSLAPANRKCTSTAFKQTGYYLLQHGKCNSSDRISVVFDCGPLGMGALAGHGHADALSFTLRAFGKDILVDSGTYDYFSYPQWREYFRSTRAHNTLVVDDRNQSEMLGLFLWGRKASAQCLSWEPSDSGGKVIGEHNGYLSLKDAVVHRRTLELDGLKSVLTIKDEILARKEHKIGIYFHLAEHCTVKPADGNHFIVDAGLGKVDILLDSAFNFELQQGTHTQSAGGSAGVIIKSRQE